MGSKRYLVFANPPTIQELRASSSHLEWQTIKFHHTQLTPSSLTHFTPQVIRHQPKNKSSGHQHCPSNQVINCNSSGLDSSTSDTNGYLQELVNSVNGSENSTIRSHKRTKLSDRPSSNNTANMPKPLDTIVDDEQAALDDILDDEKKGLNTTADEEQTVTMDSVSLDYFQTQLDCHDSFADYSKEVTLMGSAGDGNSCLLSHTQSLPHSVSSSKSSTNQPYSQTPTQQTTWSESMIVNPPQWHFDARSCTPLDQLVYSPGKLYCILFHLCQKNSLITIELKKNRKNGSTTANLAHFECMDDSGSSVKLALWDDVAESLDSVCLVGDIIYLSGIAISSYQGKIQASSTHGARAQICYRLRPTHESHVQMFCPDMRLEYDPTTHRVKELVDWAKRMFS